MINRFVLGLDSTPRLAFLRSDERAVQVLISHQDAGATQRIVPSHACASVAKWLFNRLHQELAKGKECEGRGLGL